SVQESDNNGFLYAVRQCNVSYKSPARYGDIITCEAHIDKITAAQVFFKQTIHHKETKQVIVKADVILVSLTRDFKPIAIPSEIRQKLSV
ncbi:MAG: YbgC/YbaW family acyl-CoA thioester hydrolase, partial [Lysobacterales bacterium]